MHGSTLTTCTSVNICGKSILLKFLLSIFIKTCLAVWATEFTQRHTDTDKDKDKDTDIDTDTHANTHTTHTNSHTNTYDHKGRQSSFSFNKNLEIQILINLINVDQEAWL